MNFLIAVMGDTFERVTEQKDILALRNKAQALLEVDAYVPNWMSGRANPRILMVCEAIKEAPRPCRLVFMRPPPWQFQAAARAGDATFNFLFARAGSSATTTLCTPALCAALQQYLDITPGASTFVDVAADA